MGLCHSSKKKGLKHIQVSSGTIRRGSTMCYSPRGSVYKLFIESFQIKPNSFVRITCAPCANERIVDQFSNAIVTDLSQEEKNNYGCKKLDNGGYQFNIHHEIYETISSNTMEKYFMNFSDFSAQYDSEASNIEDDNSNSAQKSLNQGPRFSGP